MDIVIDVSFRNLEKWKDSEKRSEHVFDRMQLRGIGTEQIKEAVQKGAKQIRPDGSVISEYRWFKVVYRELRMENTKKIYPITVMEA
ncbi:Uncharacterised protein [uncultured archaeon]|nr:Uncharacterised protein [uncultured archaeon]